MSFRKKIFISFLVLFILITVLIYPIVTVLIQTTQRKSLQRRTEKIIAILTEAPNYQNLLERLKQREKFLFFRITLLDPNDRDLYDSHRNLGGFRQEELATPEVQEALKRGHGFDVRYSTLFGQEMAYSAVRFFYQGNEYVMRTASPYGHIASLTHDLALAFLLLTIAILSIFSFLAWFIIHYLTQPVQQIIQAIRPYQLGKEEHIPEIKLGKKIQPTDDFGRLAETLNSLSQRIETQIATLTQEKNEKSAILESLVEGVVAVNEQMEVVYTNRMATAFLGMSEEALVGKPFSVAGQPVCEELIREAHDKGHPVAVVLKPERKQKRYFDAVAVPRGRKEGGAILVLQDKTSLHKVIELGRDFIANASHELKTPITIIRGFAETLHDHPELSAEMHTEITAKIVSNCQRMDTLVKNLLTLAAVDEGIPRSRLHECDLFDLAEQARHTILAVHHDARITITTEGMEPFTLLADSDLLFQAILNLLDNGVKYSKPPAEVNIKIHKREGEFVVEISDKGIGIPQEDVDRIFERFYAVDKSYSRSLGGSGLGLSIVERIIEKHQGKIECTSTPNLGTTFTITLPIVED